MFCQKCGTEITDGSLVCQNCEGTISPEIIPPKVEEINSQFQTSNSSGEGKASVVPEEVKGWSWGGFLLSWIWAIGNKTWIGLLGLIPCVGFIMNIILGINGREWAWKNKKWESIEQFKKVQKNWVKWWLIINLISIPILGVATLFSISSLGQINEGNNARTMNNSGLNPVEQLNKSKDTGAKNNSEVLWSAFSRYYNSNNLYPWQKDGNSNNPLLVEINSVGWMELLYSSSELKSSFKQNLSNPSEKYNLYSDGTDFYVCFKPKSKDFIEKAKTRCSTDTKISNTDLCLNNSEQVCLPENTLLPN